MSIVCKCVRLRGGVVSQAKAEQGGQNEREASRTLDVDGNGDLHLVGDKAGAREADEDSSSSPLELGLSVRLDFSRLRAEPPRGK